MPERIQILIARMLSLVLYIIAFNLFTTAATKADVVWVAGDSLPKFGRLISRDEHGGIVFLVRDEDNSYSEHKFSAEDVETLVVNIDRQRLERLDPVRLVDYRDYAEELAAQKVDPEARDLAVRLFLIVATVGSSRNEFDLVESSLAGLQPLARSEKEQSDFALLQVLYTRGQWKRLLVTDRQSHIEAQVKNREQAKSELLRAIRLIRTENESGAISILRSRAVFDELANWVEIISVEDLVAMTRSSRLSLLQLRKLLTLELALQDASDQHGDSQRSSSSWNEQAKETMVGWGRLPGFGNVTEFNPDESVFKNGRWTKPVEFDSENNSGSKIRNRN